MKTISKIMIILFRLFYFLIVVSLLIAGEFFLAFLFVFLFAIVSILIKQKNKSKSRIKSTVANEIDGSKINYRYNLFFPKRLTFQKYMDFFPDEYVVLDFETTGFEPVKSRIIEVSLIKVKNSLIVEEFSTLVNPEVRISNEIISITGITNEMIAEAPKIYEVIQKVVTMIGESPLVAHNAEFDLKFLVSAINGLTDDFELNFPVIDTVDYARQYYPNLNNHKLETIKKYLGLDYSSHRSLHDCYTTHKLLESCKEIYINTKELKEYGRNQLMNSFSDEEKQFYDRLMLQLEENKIVDEIEIRRMSNGTLNFEINKMQFGRVKLRGKKQIQVLTKESVHWIDITELSEAFIHMKYWILYIKTLLRDS